METENLIHLKPEDIAIGDNIRFGLKPYRIERLAEQILHDGGVSTPIEVQPVEGREDGKSYLLTAGHYRTAAVDKLNREQKAGMTLPARIVPLENELQRTMRQISENRERENMSPLEEAISINRLMELGVSRMDIRKTFAVAGGRKGMKVQPVSNSWLNIRRSFLDFPKDIQKKIHDGVIPVNAAQELTEHPKDKWTAIVERAEKDRIKSIDKEETDEAKYLKQAKESEEAEAAAAQTAAEYAKVKETADKAAAVKEEKRKETVEAFNRTMDKGLSKEDREAAEKHFKSVKAEVKSAEEVALKASKELEKLEDRKKTISEKAQAARARLEASRTKAKDKPAAAPAAAGKVTGTQIKKAAKDEGSVPEKKKKLNPAEMREAIKSIVILAGNKRPKTKSVGEAILSCWDGNITDGQLELAISRLTGETAMPTPPAAKK